MDGGGRRADAKKIKAFHGVEREKNDKLDAFKIAEYAYSKSDKAIIWEPSRAVVKQLKALLKCRERLVDTKKRLGVPLSEAKEFDDHNLAKEHEKLIRPVIRRVEEQIKEIEQKIKQPHRRSDY